MTSHGTAIEGYNYGSSEIAASPVSLQELELLKQAVDLSDEDIAHLRRAGDVLEDQTAAVVGSWRAVIARNPHLARYYWSRDNQPDEAYKAKVGERFKQWVIDVCRQALRSGVAELPARDRPAAHACEKECGGWRGYGAAYPVALCDRVYRRDQ